MKFYKVKDDGPGFADRYSVMFCEDSGGGMVDVFSMSADANMSNGCCIYGGERAEYEINGREIPFKTLPYGTQKQIVNIERAYEENLGGKNEN